MLPLRLGLALLLSGKDLPVLARTAQAWRAWDWGGLAKYRAQEGACGDSWEIRNFLCCPDPPVSRSQEEG